jgi:hypothetical protein
MPQMSADGIVASLFPDPAMNIVYLTGLGPVPIQIRRPLDLTVAAADTLERLGLHSP